jgi:dimethylaniline monooxygenase (N-oxide forming)
MVADGKQIHVHRASVFSFAPQSVTLSDGQVLPCDAAVFATGWKMNQSPIFPSSLLPEIGFPYALSQQSPEQAKHWNTLDSQSEAQVRKIFPMLANPPPEIVTYDKEHAKTATLTPFRTFRYIAPPKLTAGGDHSLVALGCVINTAVPIYAEVSALWGVAYLEQLPFAPSTSKMLKNVDEMETDISLVDTWGVLRFRDRAASYLDGSVEIQNFTDLLVRDLGLRADRKRFKAEKTGKAGLFGLKAWFKEWFYPYFGKDYSGLVEEYRTICGVEKRNVDE